jgi:hypothetical protein
MVRQTLLATTLFLFCISAFPEETNPPAIAGYVTAITSPAIFGVNGMHVQCTGQTQLEQADASGEKLTTQTTQDRYLGQAIDIYGAVNKKTHTIVATKVIVHLVSPVKLSGTAIIDHVPADPHQASGERLFSADGYRILITTQTQTTLTPPLTSLANIETNVWLKYTGKQRPDGVLVADTAVFTANVIPKGEDQLRTKNEYDTKAVDQDSKQSATSKFFLGTNVKKNPPYEDAAMQARVDRIGASLIPTYQRNLPDTDAAKINFRFQVIDEPQWHDARTLPNGIILVPRQVVQRLQNDSQLATVLADNIACALEKQTYRQVPANHKMIAAQLAADGGAFFVPGLGLATVLANYKVEAAILRHAEEQSGRVSLVFLHDAGYDISEAPNAWWLLAPKKPQDMIDTPLPERAAYLYQTIGTTWRSTPSTNLAASQ